MRPAPEIAYEDLNPGAVSRFGPFTVDRDEMVAFARDFDPQPFHVDDAAAAVSPVGRLIASGWFSCAVQMRILVDGWLRRGDIRGGLGIDDLRWLRPVVAGDVLRLQQTVLDKRLSATNPSQGIVRFAMELRNGRDEPVMSLTHVVLVGARDAPSPTLVTPPPHAPEPAPIFPPEDLARAPRTLDEIELGRGVDLGTYLFTPERIVAFARLYDPQDFHLDAEAATRGPFGALAASGWHTAAGWMGRFARRLDAMRAAGGAPRIAVSPGYRDLRWLRPVYAGETIRYTSEPFEKRALASRPGWGVVSSRNAGWNGRGERVFSFVGSAFWALGDAPADASLKNSRA